MRKSLLFAPKFEPITSAFDKPMPRRNSGLRGRHSWEGGEGSRQEAEAVIISDGGRELARLWAPLAKERCKAVVGIGMKGLRRKNKEK